MLRGKTMPKSDITTSTVADRCSPGSPPGALDPGNSEYENQRYGLLSHQAEPLPRFPSLSYLFSRSKSGAVKAEVTSVVWLEKPWLEVNLGERVETADDSRDQEICIARAVQDVELKGVDRLNMFEQDV